MLNSAGAGDKLFHLSWTLPVPAVRFLLPFLYLGRLWLFGFSTCSVVRTSSSSNLILVANVLCIYLEETLVIPRSTY